MNILPKTTMKIPILNKVRKSTGREQPLESTVAALVENAKSKFIRSRCCIGSINFAQTQDDAVFKNLASDSQEVKFTVALDGMMFAHRVGMQYNYLPKGTMQCMF